MDDLKYQPVEHNHEEFLRKAMVNKEFTTGYEALGPKYALMRELLAARQHSGMTQEAVALKIGTSKSAISRLESGSKHTPSVATLKKYANALGCELEIKLIPKKEPQTI